MGVEQARGSGRQSRRIGVALLRDEEEPLSVVWVEGLPGGPAQLAHGVPVRGLAQAHQPFLEAVLRGRAEGEHLHVTVPIRLRAIGPRAADVFLQQAVEVAPAEAEGADGGTAGMVDGCEPGAFVRIHVEGGGPGGHLG